MSRPTKVDPAAPVESPTAVGPLCAGSNRIKLRDLIPGARVQIHVDGKVFNAQTSPDATSQEFTLGDALPAGATVQAAQERYGVFSDLSEPPVTVDRHEDVTTSPKIIAPLVACSRMIFVRDVHPGALLAAVALRAEGGVDVPRVISDLVYFESSVGGITVRRILSKGILCK